MGEQFNDTDLGDDKMTNTSRRSFLKGGIAAAAAPALLTPHKSIAQGAPPVVYPPSPPVQLWKETLPNATPVLQPVAALNPAPAKLANTAAGEAGRAEHQRFDQLAVNPVLYDLRVEENPAWVFNPAYPPQPIWGFKQGGTPGPATTPGPTIFARYGQPVIMRLSNNLPQNHVGFGTPEISMHLHNAHTPSESDGFPSDFFSPLKAGPTLGFPQGTGVPGRFKDHFYPNVYAGLDQFGGIGDSREALGTLWYHDHTMDFTSPNILWGLSGFYLLFDNLDSGNERDPNPAALRLPSYPYDYPLIFGDKRFDANGRLFYDQFNPEGVLGDRVCVNGKIKPVLRVARRKYRFRFLNGGPSRFYIFSLVDKNFFLQRFTYIANDGNLLPQPLLNQTSVALGVAERGDIVVDFSRYPIGKELYIVNRQLQDTTREPRGVTGTGEQVLKIIVDRNPPEADVSRVPSALRPLPPLDPAEIAAAPVRRFDFDRSGGLWTINEQLFDAENPRHTVDQGRAEIWELVNMDDGWHHPIHIHFEEGRILQKVVEGRVVAIPPHERGRKDVCVLPGGPNTMTRVFIRFRDFTGKYPMHCHNLIHEDHAMMLRFDVRRP
jgi:FtsP/CotA-like multicopper oxidase with cupredoxin domain